MLRLIRALLYVVSQASEWSMATLKQMAMMNMEEILHLEGVTALTRGLEKYLQETPVWTESRLNRISELATNLGSAKLVKEAESILTRYNEILDMLHKRQETLNRAQERLSVSTIVTDKTKIQLTLTLKMTTAQVIETSVTVNNNSPIQDYVHPDDQTQPFEN